MPPRSLVRCVGDVEAFLRDAWTRRAHFHAGSGDDDYSDLLSLDHVDEILTTRSLRSPAFRLVRDGTTLAVSSYTRSGTVGGKRVDDLPDVGRVFAHFEDGATIVLQGLQRYWEPVSIFCREVENFLTHPVQANAYITPPVAAGLRVHHDTHDVFALQTHGTKQWVIYDPVVEQPLSGQNWSSEQHDPGEPTLDVDLRPGDCLYVPRGTPHAARTIDRASIHLTVGIRAYTWYDVFQDVVASAREEVDFREALPAGFAHDPEGFTPAVAARLKDMAAFLERADAADAAAAVSRKFHATRQPLLRGHLRDLLEIDRVDDETVVVRRFGSVCRVEPAGDEIRVHLGDRRLTMPAALEPAVRRAASGDPLRVGDLDDLLDDESRVVFARRLVREGLLRVEEARPTAPGRPAARG